MPDKLLALPGGKLSVPVGQNRGSAATPCGAGVCEYLPRERLLQSRPSTGKQRRSVRACDAEHRGDVRPGQTVPE